mgnify:CR=1 FL=1
MQKLLIVIASLFLIVSTSFADVDTFEGQTGTDTWEGQSGVDTREGQVVASGGAPACTSITVDYWQDFELSAISTAQLEAHDNNACSSCWTITDNGGLSVSASGESTMDTCPGGSSDSGSNGLALLWSGRPDSSVTLNISTAKANLSGGFWVKTVDVPSWSGGIILISLQDSTSTTRASLINKRDGGTNAQKLGTYTCSTDTWYWVAWEYVQNDYFYYEIYSADGTQVATDSASVGDYTIKFIKLFNRPATDAEITSYMDDVVVDVTDATHPLMGVE